MVSARPFYILQYLEAGYDVIYFDIDTMWLQNPISSFVGALICGFFMSTLVRREAILGLWQLKATKEQYI